MPKPKCHPAQRRQIKRLYAQGLSCRKVAKRVGVSGTCVHNYLRQINMIRSHSTAQRLRQKDTRERIEGGVELYQMGMSGLKVGKIAGVGHESILRTARQMGIARGHHGRPGRRINRRVIRHLGRMAYEGNLSLAEIARRTGISYQKVQYRVALYTKDLNVDAFHKARIIRAVRTAQYLREQGCSYELIAEQLNASPRTVERYCNNPESLTTWRMAATTT